MFPDALTVKIAPPLNAALDALVSDHGHVFRAGADALLVALVAVETALRGAPWWLVIAVFAALAYAGARTRRGGALGAAGAAAALFAIGVLGLWDAAMQTLALMLLATAVCAVLGVPLGVLMARRPRVGAGLRPVLDAMQTLPSFVYLIPAMMLLGLGKVPALLATVIYALPPVARLTDLGLRQANADAVEAADAYGATPRQKLWLVELPLALPSVMAGLTQAILLALSMVVVAAMIGARGLGEEVLLGIQRLDVGRGLAAGLAIVALAVVVDRLAHAHARRFGAAR